MVETYKRYKHRCNNIKHRLLYPSNKLNSMCSYFVSEVDTVVNVILS